MTGGRLSALSKYWSTAWCREARSVFHPLKEMTGVPPRVPCRLLPGSPLARSERREDERALGGARFTTCFLGRRRGGLGPEDSWPLSASH